MLATLIHGTRDIRVETVPDPTIARPTDAVVRVVAACVCGSDLWPYRGATPTAEPRRIGHELIGIVEETGKQVTNVKAGDFVVAPFALSDNTCVHCRHGVHTSCSSGLFWGQKDREGLLVDGAQGEFVRVALADGTLVATPEQPDADLIPALLTLADVFPTGHHAAVSGGVTPGATVAVVGDGAVGQCAVLAAKRIGADRIIIMSRHADRQELARRFGATDVVQARGDEGAAEVKELLGGIGADVVLECVGTKESMAQALASVRPGGRIGWVGAPNGGPEFPMRQLFNNNIGVGGGVAPVRNYLEELIPEVLDGRLDPGAVFDLKVTLTETADAYVAMDERRSIKTMITP